MKFHVKTVSIFVSSRRRRVQRSKAADWGGLQDLTVSWKKYSTTTRRHRTTFFCQNLKFSSLFPKEIHIDPKIDDFDQITCQFVIRILDFRWVESMRNGAFSWRVEWIKKGVFGGNPLLVCIMSFLSEWIMSTGSNLWCQWKFRVFYHPYRYLFLTF